MEFALNYRTDLLSEQETIAQRHVVAGRGERWACECCGFEEPSVIAWRKIGISDVRLSCAECHPYQDPWRYRDEVVVAWLPKYEVAVLSHLVKLTAMSVRLELPQRLLNLATKEAQPQPSVARFLRSVSVGDARTENSSDSIGTDEEAQISASLGASVSNAVSHVGKDIADGIVAASYAFGSASFAEIVTALEVGPERDRDFVASGVRFIPKTISTKRVIGWSEVSAIVIAEVLREIIEVSKLSEKSSASDPVLESPGVGIAQNANAVPDLPDDPEVNPAVGSKSRSLLSFLRFSGARQ